MPGSRRIPGGDPFGGASAGSGGGPKEPSGTDESRAARFEKEAQELATQVTFLEEEVLMLRRKLTESPRHLRSLEDRLGQAQAMVAQLTSQNEKLVVTLREARDQILALKEEVDRLAQPPSGYGVFLAAHDDGSIDVFHGGRKLRVAPAAAEWNGGRMVRATADFIARRDANGWRSERIADRCQPLTNCRRHSGANSCAWRCCARR